MAVKLTSKPNTHPIDTDYPYGDIKDQDGLNIGTPVSREVYADFHQFFERLMARAEITHNDLPDNEYSGFQLFEAFVKCIQSPFRDCILSVSQTGTNAPVVTIVRDTFPFAGGFNSAYSAQGLFEITANAPDLGAWNYIQVIPSAGEPSLTAGETVDVRFANETIYINTKNSGGFDANGIISNYIIWIRDWEPLILP
jgi:hypothetical protein